jgi:hypothetical protein
MIRLFKIQYLSHCWSENLQNQLHKILLIEHFPTIPKEHPQFSFKNSFWFYWTFNNKIVQH